MRGMFKDNIPLAELVLRIIVGKPDLIPVSYTHLTLPTIA